MFFFYHAFEFFQFQIGVQLPFMKNNSRPSLRGVSRTRCKISISVQRRYAGPRSLLVNVLLFNLRKSLKNESKSIHFRRAVVDRKTVSTCIESRNRLLVCSHFFTEFFSAMYKSQYFFSVSLIIRLYFAKYV